MLKQIRRICLPVIALSALVLSACSLGGAAATPTPAVDAIYTAAAMTVAAIPTQPSATITATETPEITDTPAATSTDIGTVAPPPASTSSITGNYCDNSVYISDVTIPDKTVMSPGQSFDKTWAFQNTGSCAWTTGYTIVFQSGDLMSGNTRPLVESVAPQAQENVTVKLIAPNTAGTYTGWWRLVNGKGQAFGNTVSVVIVVGSVTTTTTVTPTSGGATATSAPGATKTPTPTSPPAATATHTATPTATTPAPAATETPTVTATPTK